MNSLRLLGRAVPKSSSLRPLSSRCYSVASRNAARPSWQAVKKFSYPSFSTSIARKEASGDGDQLLAAKFQSERDLELESNNEKPDIEAFKAQGVWEITDKPGTHEIVLQRTMGNETIKVEVSILSMMDYAEQEDMDLEEEDTALMDEEFEQKRTINQSGTKGGPIDVAPEDSIAPADREGDFDEAAPQSYPIDLEITIEKSKSQSIAIHARAQDGDIEIERIQFLEPNAAEDDSTTPYAGPPFTNLDTDLIWMLQQYVQERGINEELVQILPGLIEQKEQTEYVDWLQKMQKFIEA